MKATGNGRTGRGGRARSEPCAAANRRRGNGE